MTKKKQQPILDLKINTQNIGSPTRIDFYASLSRRSMQSLKSKERQGGSPRKIDGYGSNRVLNPFLAAMSSTAPRA